MNLISLQIEHHTKAIVPGSSDEELMDQSDNELITTPSMFIYIYNI